MPALNLGLRYYLIFASSLIVFYIFGNRILRFANIHKKIVGPYANLFFSLLVGLVAFICVYSVVKTSFRTINIVFLIIIVMLWMEMKNIKKEKMTTTGTARFPLRSLLILFLSSVFMYSWSFFSIYNGRSTGFPYVIPSYDYLYHSNISYFLPLTGQENIFHVFNLMDAAYHGPTPYHFFELWLNGGISKTINGLNILTLFLVTYPIFYLVSFLGFLAIAEIFGVNFFTVLICFLSLFLGGAYFDLYARSKFSFLHEAVTFNGSLMSSFFPQLSYYYIFILGFYYAYLKNQKIIAFLILAGAGIASISAYPALLVGVTIFCFSSRKYNFLSKEKIKTLMVYIIIVMSAILLFYCMRYATQCNTERTNIEYFINKNYGDLFSFQAFRHRFNNIAAALIIIALLYAPFCLLFIIFRKRVFEIFQKRDMQQLAIISVFVFISGMLAWVSAYKMFEGIALFYHFSIPLLNCFVFLIVLNLINQKINTNKSIFRQGVSTYLIIAVCLAVSFNQIFLSYNYMQYRKAQQRLDDNYIEEIKSYLANQSFCQGVSIKDRSEYPTTLSKYTAAYAFGGYLPFLKNGFAPVSISFFDITVEERAKILTAVSAGIFYQFIGKQKKEATFKSIEQSQVDFIDAYKVKYAIVSKAAKIPPAIRHRIKRQFDDKLSGERFLVFR